jgi:hypothetical protein
MITGNLPSRGLPLLHFWKSVYFGQCTEHSLTEWRMTERRMILNRMTERRIQPIVEHLN